MSSGVYEWMTSSISTQNCVISSDQEPHYVYYTTASGTWIDYEQWNFLKEYQYQRDLDDYARFWDINQKIKLNKCVRTI